MVIGKEVSQCREVDYVSIRMAMAKQGARTVEEVRPFTGAASGCGGCFKEIEKILASACSCSGTSMKEVVAAVKAGATSVDMLAEVTGAGAECGRCQVLLQNVLESSG